MAKHPVELTEKHLSDLSSIQVRYLVGELVAGRRVLVLRFEGSYRPGSAGNPDAVYMRAVAAAGLVAFHAQAVLVDLSGLAYQWGDMIEAVFDPGPDYVPSAVLVGPDCREALGTLLSEGEEPRDVTDNPGFFDEMEAAFKYLRRRLEELRTKR